VFKHIDLTKKWGKPLTTAMTDRSIFSTRFFAIDEIRLGNLIPNIRQPDLNNFQSSVPLKDDVFTVKEVEDCLESSKSKGSYGLGLFLTPLFTQSFNHSHSEDASLVARRGRMYTLNQATATFRELCGDDKAKRWLEEQIAEANDVYFVIGLDTLFEAEKHGGREDTADSSGQLAITISEAAGIPLGGATNVGSTAERGQSSGTRWAFRAPGENIYGVRMQKVVFDFWKKTVESAKLGRGEYWYTVSESRGGEQEGEFVQAFLGSDENELDGPQETEDGGEPIYICDVKHE